MTYNYSRKDLVIFLRTVAKECDTRSTEGQWTVNADLLREAATMLEIPKTEENTMTQNQIALAKGVIIGAVIKKKSNMAKAYLALAAAAVYGIRAARDANEMADSAVATLKEERRRPVIVVEGE